MLINIYFNKMLFVSLKLLLN